MLFNTPLRVIKKIRVSDGMGGSKSTKEEVSKIYTVFTDVSSEITMETLQVLENRIIKRVLTENSLPEDFTEEVTNYTVVDPEGNEYRIVDYRLSQRPKALTVERVGKYGN